MALKSLKKIFATEDEFDEGNASNAHYKVSKEEAFDEAGNSKMILLEPRAFSEAEQIVNYLLARNAVVVNTQRVTTDQARRILDFISGAVTALGGKTEKLGTGIFLCTPNNINVQGKITDEVKNKKEKEINTEW